MNINDCLTEITTLTRENLKILRALNDSLFTNKNHILVNVNGNNYAVPSFISLENKIDMLEENLNNVLNAPKTGEAFTYFDGTTQKLELGGYATTPPHVDITATNTFNCEPNNIFKDFMNPNPYVKLGVGDIPNNIKHVNVKKIALKNPELISLINKLSNIGEDSSNALVNYPDIHKILFSFKPEVDYVEYDSIHRLPTRTGGAYGEYRINKIVNNSQDENFEEHYTLELDKDLVYFINNGTIQRNIVVGDLLVTRDDRVQMVVERINQTSRTIEVKILYGGYANLCDVTSNNKDLCELKFYKPIDYKDFKYINIPLEEDSNILIFIATINDTTNIQSPWGTGVYFNVDNLRLVDSNTDFRTYYNKYVNNVGDALTAITHMMDDDAQVEKLTHQEFKNLREFIPGISSKDIVVTQINKHLNDSKNIKAIRKLYDQKNQYKVELDKVQRDIDKVNKDLSEVSFDDTNNTRTVYVNQLSELNSKKRELIGSIAATIKEIEINANDSDVPIENAKYHIRGFVNVKAFDEDPKFKAKVIKIDVEYRYKNKNKFTGNAETISDGNYIYSDWNKMRSEYRKMIPAYENNQYIYKLDETNEDKNEISFNQIDIPISQGESVDIRVRYIYNLGYPFVEMTSAWSPIYNQTFPQEYLKNIEILDIITENSSDSRRQQFMSILDNKGITDHVNDSVQDQTIKYYHTPEHIASGFYTKERRIIPLLDKLKDIDSSLAALMSEVYGAVSDSLVITLSDINNTTLIKPNVVNTFRTVSYSDNETKTINERVDPTKSFAYSQLTLAIQNTGDYPIKLYSIFPGNYNDVLSEKTVHSKFDVNDYIDNPSNAGERNSRGVYMQLDELASGKFLVGETKEYYTCQRLNQYLYFRTKYNGADTIYSDDIPDIVDQDNIQGSIKLSGNPNLSTKDNIFEHRDRELKVADDISGTKRAAFLFPYPGTIDKICISSDDEYLMLEPGSSVVIPISFYYWIDTNNNRLNNSTVTRSLMFDIRTSLFKDPVTYKFNITANYTDTQNFKAVSKTKLDKLPPYNVTAVNLSRTNSFPKPKLTYKASNVVNPTHNKYF